MTQPAFKRHPYDDAQAAELARWPGVSWTREFRGKHLAIVLTRGKVSRFVTYPATPGDEWRGALNHVRDLRKELTALGATRQMTLRRTAAKRQRNRTEATSLGLQSVADTRLARDPFAALATLKVAEPAAFAQAAAPPPSLWQRIAARLRKALKH